MPTEQYNSPGTYTWTCPAGVTSATVECWGAGGGGSGITSNAYHTGGAKGGSYAASTISVTPGTGYTVVVGARGVGGTTGGASQGYPSSFGGGTVSAAGGHPSNAFTQVSVQASGRTTSNGTTTGQTTVAGSDGGASWAGSTTGGVGGAGANGGSGGSAGSGSASSAGNGGFPGGGGGGCGRSSAGSQLGGHGGDGRVLITYTVDTTGPSTPGTPSASQASSSGYTVNLSWSASSDSSGVSGYRLYRATSSGGALTYIKSVSGTSTTDNPGANGSYWYAVDAYDPFSNYSSQSGRGAVTVDVDTTPPANVSGVAWSYTAATGALQLYGWSLIGDATRYRVYRDGSLRGDTGSNTNSYTDNVGANTDFSYTYRITSVDAAGNESSGYSLVVSRDTTPPSVPTWASYSATGTTVNLSWNASSGSPSFYHVYRNGAYLKLVNAPTTSTTDVPSLSGTYTYTLYAFDASGNQSSVSAGAPVTVTYPYNNMAML